MAMDDESASGPTYQLIVSFPDQSASFAHGFSAGKIWADMTRGDVAEIQLHMPIENREVIARMADRLGWSVTVTPTDTEGWDDTLLVKVRPEREKANPHGLRVVTR